MASFEEGFRPSHTERFACCALTIQYIICSTVGRSTASISATYISAMDLPTVLYTYITYKGMNHLLNPRCHHNIIEGDMYVASPILSKLKLPPFKWCVGVCNILQMCFLKHGRVLIFVMWLEDSSLTMCKWLYNMIEKKWWIQLSNSSCRGSC